MRVSVSWLRSLLSTQATTEELAEVLTQGGIEVESIEKIGLCDPNVLVAEVLENRHFEKAPGLTLLRVDAGIPLTLLTRCPNAAALTVGKKIVVAKPGVVVWQHEPSLGLTSVKGNKVLDVVSEGAVVSAFALGCGEDPHQALIVDESVPPGTPAHKI